MSAWRWIGRDVVFAIHDVQLAQHGGLDGVKDMHAIASAHARPQQLHAYGDPPPDVFDLAASYGFGFARHHGFSDGNKRTAWVLARLFLADNGVTIQFTPHDAIQAMLGVAAGTLAEQAFADWLRVRRVP
ncbi:MAG: type II toxin-antitoxin system death-on-curing family toxin [Proteobacteria bacterium]|nr:type II toxin-antitoxin system death-on-curing family toxin [Pseudomonadota bacterium]